MMVSLNAKLKAWSVREGRRERKGQGEVRGRSEKSSSEEERSEVRAAERTRWR